LESFVGNYDEAYRYEDTLYADFPSTKYIIEQYKKDVADVKKSSVADYKMLDAIAAIDSIADKNQVIMINEEHRTPFHRALTLQLLAKLYSKGFRYFAAETVNEEDAELTSAAIRCKKPELIRLTRVYADVIRTALRLGYKIVPYETRDATCKSPERQSEFCNDRRERDQAKNLYERILKDDPQAKFSFTSGAVTTRKPRFRRNLILWLIIPKSRKSSRSQSTSFVSASAATARWNSRFTDY
jgi:hypothetical protein